MDHDVINGFVFQWWERVGAELKVEVVIHHLEKAIMRTRPNGFSVNCYAFDLLIRDTITLRKMNECCPCESADSSEVGAKPDIAFAVGYDIPDAFIAQSIRFGKGLESSSVKHGNAL